MGEINLEYCKDKKITPIGDFNRTIKRVLNNNLDFEEKEVMFNEIVTNYEYDILNNWESPQVKMLLCKLADYLYPKNTENELSNYKIRGMVRGNKFYSNFSDLNIMQKEKLGIFSIRNNN